MAIFKFAVNEVPAQVKALAAKCDLTLEEVDYFVFHQANKIINETIRKILRVPPEKMPYSLKEYGNTVGASIPVTLVAQIREQAQAQKLKLLLSGFGVGLSWGSCYLETENIVCPPMIEV